MAYDPRESMTMKIGEMRIDPLTFTAQMTATNRFRDEYPGASIDYEKQAMHMLDQQVHRMRLSLLAHQGEPIVISYPRNWWDAVKARFAPVWFQARWPVQFDTHTIYPWAVLPNLKTPPGQRVIRWAEHVSPGNVRAWHTEDV
jgi:hypothetical protein